MDKWEYKVLHDAGNCESLENKLNALGKEGWEALACPNSYSTILKRKIPTSPSQTVQKPVQNQSRDDDFGISF